MCAMKLHNITVHAFTLNTHEQKELTAGPKENIYCDQNSIFGSVVDRIISNLYNLAGSGSASWSHETDLAWIRVAHKKSTKILRISYYFLK